MNGDQNPNRLPDEKPNNKRPLNENLSRNGNNRRSTAGNPALIRQIMWHTLEIFDAANWINLVGRLRVPLSGYLRSSVTRIVQMYHASLERAPERVVVVQNIPHARSPHTLGRCTFDCPPCRAQLNGRKVCITKRRLSNPEGSRKEDDLDSERYCLIISPSVRSRLTNRERSTAAKPDERNMTTENEAAAEPSEESSEPPYEPPYEPPSTSTSKTAKVSRARSSTPKVIKRKSSPKSKSPKASKSSKVQRKKSRSKSPIPKTRKNAKKESPALVLDRPKRKK